MISYIEFDEPITKCEFCNNGYPGNWKMKCSTCDVKYVLCAQCNEKSAGKKWRNYCKQCYRNQKIDILTQINYQHVE